jgi:hypothetical protein
LVILDFTSAFIDLRILLDLLESASAGKGLGILLYDHVLGF